MNTAIIVLLANTRLSSGTSIDDFVYDINAGKYYDITPEWVEGVGTTLAYTMFINVFTPPFFSFMTYLIHQCKIARD
jgi:hypothetical protein